MISFRGLQWIYDVTKADEQTRARAASFVCRLHQPDRVNDLRRVTRRPSSTARERQSSAGALACPASAGHSRVASDPFLVTTFGNSSASPDPELSDPHDALRT
jgi:hypothetical protein